MTLAEIVIEDAIVGLPPVGPPYATAVFVYLCHANVLAGCECSLRADEWRSPEFPTQVIA